MNNDRFDPSVPDAVSEEQRHAAAMSDPDNLPLTDDDVAHGLTKPPVQLIWLGLGMTREELSKRDDIAPAIICEGRSVPEQPARRRLQAIARELEHAGAAASALR